MTTDFPTGRQATRGFTLLELLVATAIGAIVLLVINATFFGALRLHNTTHDRIDQDLELQRALGIIRKDLAGIMLPGGVFAGQLQTTASTSPTLDFTGDRVTPDLFTNSARIDGWNSFSEVQMVSYFLAPAADGGNTKSLVRVVTRNLLPVTDATVEEQTLLPYVTSATMLFYDGTDWTDTWDSSETSTLPSAIKFSLVLAPRDGTTTNGTPAPVEIIVPILVTSTASQQAIASTGQ